ncbi:MAG: LysM peptidoglycan-binding domain-containing protein [Microscillaceae bacterium]|nr:LysM peptidoglycan-binding domain-containing protein [Microscillaceae bacterium]
MTIQLKHCSIILFFVVLCPFTCLKAQQVPNQIEFAGIQLQLNPAARQTVQNEVNLLLEDREAFRKKIKTADTFMPLITEILQKNELPLDFKYLALLDNTIPDSLVFWQMAENLALDLGLEINDAVDERQNLFTATEKISNFLKINHVVFQNWWLTLLSYQFKSSKPQEEFKKLFPNMTLSQLALQKEFRLDQNTHPQVLKLIAQAVAYSQAMSTSPQREIELVNYTEASDQSLEELAQSFSLSLQELKKYNTWLKAAKIPQDKKYDLIVPMPAASPSTEVRLLTAPGGEFEYFTKDESYVHIVESGETLYKISRQYQVPVQNLMKWNQLNQSSILKVGQKLYIAAETATKELENIPQAPTTENTQNIFTHKVQKGETLYRISRKYNVSLDNIRKWNGLQNDNLYVGQTIKIQAEQGPSNPTKPEINTPTEENTPSNPVPVKETPPTPPVNTPTPNTPGPRSIKPKLIPDALEIGGIRLNITREGKKALKKDVDLLIKSQTYFFSKLNRVDLYLPLVEEALRSQQVPDDFKYLPIQESALIAAAESSSKAVGYWQFKEESGVEVGLAINSRVDERMNIVASSLAACKYLNRSNLYFKNWIITLLSYNMGFSGAKFYIQKTYPGKDFKNLQEMDIDENTHWYIRKFLAHKIAFEQEIGLYPLPKKLSKYTEANDKTLKQIAEETHSSEEEMLPHNLWLKKNRIPDDKTYTVIVPLEKD